jgi:hypothetical protein
MIRETVAALLLATMIAVVAVTIIGIGAARGGTICLTKKEARELWPRIHIWWYRDKQTGDRCWSNRRGPPRHLKIDPIINSMAQEFSFRHGGGRETVSPSLSSEDKCCWPVLPRDSDGKIIEPPPTFSERWQTILSVFRKWWPQ